MMTTPQKVTNALSVFGMVLVGGVIGLGVIFGVLADDPDGPNERVVGPSPTHSWPDPQRIVWPEEYKADHPDCTDARVWPASDFAAEVLVMKTDGKLARMAFDVAWKAVMDDDTTNDVWVIGMCGDPIRMPR